MTQLAKLCDSFDKHWFTLIASMSPSKWKSPSKWNLLIPRELRGSTETVLSSLLTMCLSIPGLEINFFAQVPAGDQGETFGRQIINFGRQLCMQEKS